MAKHLDLCRQLLGQSLVPTETESVPPDLMATYTRIFAAKSLGELPATPLSGAVLCRVALTEAEDDRVRVEAVQQLLNLRSPLAEAVLIALLFDDDPAIRTAAIEGLVLMKSENLQLLQEVLSTDEVEEIKALATLACHGGEIPLYFLDPP